MNNNLILPTELICGYFDCSMFGDLKISPERTRTLFEIEYYLEDGKTTFSNGIAYPIKKDYVRISSPGEVGNSLLPFKTKYVKFQAEGALAELLSNAPRYFRVHCTFEVLTLLDEVISLHSDPNCDRLLLHGKLLILISLLLEEAKNLQHKKTATYNTVLQAKAFIKKNYSTPIKLCDIASEVHLSPSYFHRLFTKVCGITPHDFLMEHRVRAAKECLLTTSATLCEIAERCGFCNQQYMTAVFKVKTGRTPTQYRCEHQMEYLE